MGHFGFETLHCWSGSTMYWSKWARSHRLSMRSPADAKSRHQHSGSGQRHGHGAPRHRLRTGAGPPKSGTCQGSQRLARRAQRPQAEILFASALRGRAQGHRRSRRPLARWPEARPDSCMPPSTALAVSPKNRSRGGLGDAHGHHCRPSDPDDRLVRRDAGADRGVDRHAVRASSATPRARRLSSDDIGEPNYYDSLGALQTYPATAKTSTRKSKFVAATAFCLNAYSVPCARARRIWQEWSAVPNSSAPPLDSH